MAQYQYLWDIHNPDEFNKLKIYDLIKLYQNSGIIPLNSSCEFCENEMYLSPNKNCADTYKWRCLNWRRQKCPKKSIRKNTILECFRLSLSDIGIIFLSMIQGRSNIEIEKKISASYTTILRLHKCFQRICKMIVDQSQGSSSPTDIQKIKDAIQSIPNLTKENMFELNAAEIKARQMYGPLLHYSFWRTDKMISIGKDCLSWNMPRERIFIFTILALFIIGASCTSTAKTCGPNGDADCPLRCQDNVTGSITSLAVSCSDEVSDCDIVFACQTDDNCEADPANVPAGTFDINDPDTYPKVRSPACDIASMQDKVMQCARTCMVCCEAPQYNCEDDDSGTIDCDLNKAKCTDSNWTNVMAQYCPQTCGLCTNGTCKDTNSGCAQLSTLCKNVDWVTYMQTHCARTCDTCSGSSSGCTNIASNCAENANLCTNPTYRSLMQQQCCATCTGTTGSTGQISCSDSSSACLSWVRNGFCTSSFYTTDQKRSYCASSCNLC